MDSVADPQPRARAGHIHKSEDACFSTPCIESSVLQITFIQQRTKSCGPNQLEQAFRRQRRQLRIASSGYSTLLLCPLYSAASLRPFIRSLTCLHASGLVLLGSDRDRYFCVVGST